MIRVSFNGKNYKLYFQYTTVTKINLGDLIIADKKIITSKKINDLVNQQGKIQVKTNLTSLKVKHTYLTSAFLENLDDSTEIYKGKAICHPNDKFEKAIGRTVAIDNLCKINNLSKDFRNEIIEKYDNR